MFCFNAADSLAANLNKVEDFFVSITITERHFGKPASAIIICHIELYQGTILAYCEWCSIAPNSRYYFAHTTR